MTDAVVKPVIEATLEYRPALSDCCGARLMPDVGTGGYACRACGEPCQRVLGDPQTIKAVSNG